MLISSVAKALHQRRRATRWVHIEAVARRKLDQLDAASELHDVASPPGNRLEALSGNRKGQHSIRVNDQLRVFSLGGMLSSIDHGPKLALLETVSAPMSWRR